MLAVCFRHFAFEPRAKWRFRLNILAEAITDLGGWQKVGGDK